jgi:hypothetical protein
MTKEYIEQILIDMDIQRGSKLWAEYQRGKMLIAVLNISESEYAEAMKIIADFVGV